MTHHVKQETFQREVLEAATPVLIDFYADWCVPCRMLAPVLEEIAAESPELKVCKVNIDEEPELARLFHIASIPTLVAMQNGEITGTSMGVRPKQEILQLLTV